MAREAIIDRAFDNEEHEEYLDTEREYCITYHLYFCQDHGLFQVVDFHEYDVESYLRYVCRLGLLSGSDIENLYEKNGWNDDGSIDGVLTATELGRLDIIEYNNNVDFDFLEAVRAFENGTGKIIDAMNETKRIAQVIREVRQYEEQKYESYSIDTSPQPNTNFADDIANLLDTTQWQLVSVNDFLNPNINSDPSRPFSSRELEEDRQNGKITWLDESQGIGRDADGRYLQRTGKDKHNFRYCYFLRCEFHKESNE